MRDSSKRIGIIVVALLPVLALGFFVFHKDTDDLPPVITQQATPTPSMTTATITPPAPTMMGNKTNGGSTGMMSVYKNGTFTATGTYRSPEGTDALDVTVTIQNDIVTAVSLVEKPSNSTSKLWQDAFAAGYQPFVIGKSLADLKLTNVSGASLTPKGFNDAIKQIRTQAAV